MASTGMKILCLFWVLCPTMALVAKMKRCKDGVAVTHSSVYMKPGVRAWLGMTDITNGEFFETGENGPKDYCLKKGSNLTLSLTQTSHHPIPFEMSLRHQAVQIVIHAKPKTSVPPQESVDLFCPDICKFNCTFCAHLSSSNQCVDIPDTIVNCPSRVQIADLRKVPNPFAKFAPMMNSPPGNETMDMVDIMQAFSQKKRLKMPATQVSIPSDWVNALPDAVKQKLVGKRIIVQMHVSLANTKNKKTDWVAMDNEMEVDI